MQYKTIVIAVLSALALSACGAGGGGAELGVKNTDAASTKGSESGAVSFSESDTDNQSGKMTANVPAATKLINGAIPAIEANGINLRNRFINTAYEGGPFSFHVRRLTRLGFAEEPHATVTPVQLESAKQLKASLQSGPGMTNSMNQQLEACLDKVIAGDGEAGYACLKDYYIHLYALTIYALGTVPQPSPLFETEVNQDFSSDRVFPKQELQPYATTGRMWANLSIDMSELLAKVPASDVMKGDAFVNERFTKNLFAIPQEQLLRAMTRPARPQQLDVDFEVVKGESNTGITLHFFSSGMMLKADANGWTVELNGLPYHGGNTGLIKGVKVDLARDDNVGISSDSRRNTTLNSSTESSASQELSSGFKF